MMNSLSFLFWARVLLLALVFISFWGISTEHLPFFLLCRRSLGVRPGGAQQRHFSQRDPPPAPFGIFRPSPFLFSPFSSFAIPSLGKETDVGQVAELLQFKNRAFRVFSDRPVFLCSPPFLSTSPFYVHFLPVYGQKRHRKFGSEPCRVSQSQTSKRISAGAFPLSFFSFPLISLRRFSGSVQKEEVRAG